MILASLKNWKCYQISGKEGPTNVEVSPQGDKLNGRMKLGDRFKGTVRGQQTDSTDLLNKNILQSILGSVKFAYKVGPAGETQKKGKQLAVRVGAGKWYGEEHRGVCVLGGVCMWVVGVWYVCAVHVRCICMLCVASCILYVLCVCVCVCVCARACDYYS